MAKLGAALSYNPFEPAPAAEAKLGEPVDFNPFEAAATPDEQELNLPPLQGTPAPNAPMPLARPADVPLPTPRPANLGEETAPTVSPLQASIVPTTEGLVGAAPSVPVMPGIGFGGAPETPPTGNEPGIAAAIPGGLEVKKQLQSLAVAGEMGRAQQLSNEFKKAIDLAKSSGASQQEIDRLQAKADEFDKKTGLLQPQIAAPLAALAKTEAEIKAQPQSDFSKKYADATQAGGIKGWITGTYDAIKADPLGAAKGFTATMVESAPQVAATVAGGPAAPVTGGLYAAGQSYANALIEETVKRGGDINDPKKFQAVYEKYKDDIDVAAKAHAAVAGTFNAAMGLIPGGNTLGQGVKNVLLKYTPIQVAQGIIENKITTVNKLDPQTGQPVVDANGNPVLVHLDGLKPSEIANMVAQGIITSIPFEARHLLPERQAPAQAQATGQAPPPGAEAGKAPGETPNAPPGAGPEEAAPPKEGRQSTAEYNAAFPVNNDSALMAGFENDIRSGRMSREDALDRIAKMTPEEAAQKAELFRQVGGKDVEGYKIATADDAYLENKRKEFGTHPEVTTEAPGPQPSPDESVEAREAGAAPPPPGATVDEPTASILKGAGYDMEDIMAMSPTERAAEVASAKKAKVKPADLTDQERETLSGKPAQAETAAPPPPEAPAAAPEAPSTKGTELVAQGVEPLEAMKEAAAAPLPPTAPTQNAPSSSIENLKNLMGRNEPTPEKKPIEAKTYGDIIGPNRYEPNNGFTLFPGTNQEAHFRFDTYKDHNSIGMSRNQLLGEPAKFTSDKDTDRRGGNIRPNEMLEKLKDPVLADLFTKFVNKEITKEQFLEQLSKTPIKAEANPIPPEGMKAAAEPAPIKAQPIPEPVAEVAAEPVAKPVAAEEAPAPVEPKAPKAPKVKAAPVEKPKTLFSLVRSLGGLKEGDAHRGELRSRDLHRIPGIVNNKTGRSLEDFVISAVEHGYYPEWRDRVLNNEGGVTQQMVDKVLNDLASKRNFNEAVEQRQSEALTDEEEHRLENYKEDIRDLLKDMDHTASDELLHDAGMVMLRGEEDPMRALELAHMGRVAELMPDENDSIRDITGEDFWNTVEQHRIDKEEEAPRETKQRPTPEAGPAPREEGQPVEQPEGKEAIEGRGQPVEEVRPEGIEKYGKNGFGLETKSYRNDLVKKASGSKKQPEVMDLKFNPLRKQKTHELNQQWNSLGSNLKKSLLKHFKKNDLESIYYEPNHTLTISLNGKLLNFRAFGDGTLILDSEHNANNKMTMYPDGKIFELPEGENVPTKDVFEPVANAKELEPNKADSTLVLMACGGSKLETSKAVPLSKLYTGPMWQTFREHKGSIGEDQVLVLSGKYGLVPGTKESLPYEETITEDKINQLVKNGIDPSILGGKKYDQVIIAGGGLYRKGFNAIVNSLKEQGALPENVKVVETTGGIGSQRGDLGNYLRQVNGQGKAGLKPTAEAGAEGKPQTVIPGTGLSIEHKLLPNLSPKAQGKKINHILKKYFTPGNIVISYGGKDKVIAFKGSYESGNWSATVQQINADGSLENRVRNHSTFPDKKALVQVLGKDYNKDFVVTGDLAKNKALLDKLGFEPVRTINGVPQRVFIGDDPTEAIKAALKPTTEAGVEGKPQMVIPGAEKISGGELAQRKADQPLRPKYEQKEPGGLFGDESKQKDLMDLIKQPESAKPQVMKSAPEWAEKAAKAIGGRVIYHNGDVAIALGHNRLTCKPIYIAVRKSGDSFVRTKNDIIDHDFSKSGGFTSEQVSELTKARSDYKKRDHELWEANPDGPFVGDAQFVVSPSISPEIAGIFDQWAKLMGIESKIYLVDPDDAAKTEYHGPYKMIQAAVGERDPFTIQIMKGQHFISLPKKARTAMRLEILAHEMGHILQKDAYDSLDAATKKAIQKEFNSWYNKVKVGSVRQNFDALRTPVMARMIEVNGKVGIGQNIPASRLPTYWRSFDEWFADQVSRWAQTEAKPQSVVEQFFSRLAAALKRFYATVAGSKFFPSKTMRDFMNERANRKDNIGQGSESDEFGGDSKSYAHNSFDEDSIDEINRMNAANGMGKKQQKAVVKSFEEPAETWFGKARRGIQDEFAYQRAVQDAIERSSGAPLPDSLDVYMKTNLLPGRVSEGMRDIQKEEAEPLFKKMKENDVSKDELGGYLLAHHALERNAEIANRNPKMPDGGSGIMNQTAVEMLDKYQNGPKAKQLEELAQDVYAIRDRDMQRRVDAGLISQADADAYKAAAPRYVPLFGFAEREAAEDRTSGYNGMNLGKGLSVSPSEWRQMTGRTSIPDNPLMNVILRAQEGVYRVEKNNVAKALYRLAKSQPNPDLWVVNKPVMKKIVGDDGYVTWSVEGMITPSTVVAKIGGQPYYIRLNNDGLAEAFKKVGLNQLPQFLQKFSELNRFYSQLQTGKNLDFMAKNVSRDVLDALTYTYIRDPKVAARFATSYFSALATAVRHSLGIMSPAQKAIFDEWRQNGGRISYYRGGDIEQIAKDIQAIAGKADPISWKNLPVKARRALWNVLTAIPNAMEKLNAPLEEATRLSVYMAAKKSGYSDGKSSMMSLDATVNFNRRGKYTSYANAYKWFFNAALQPAFTWARLLNSPRGRRVAAALVGIGFANGLRNLMASDDDKMQKGRKNYMNIPEWEKQGSLIIKTGPGEKDYIKIPIGAQLNIPFYLGDKIATLFAGQSTGAETAANAASGMFWSAMPIASGPLAQMLAPSIIQPLVDLYYNQKWTGSPVHPPETTFNKGTPHSEQESKNTPPMFTEFTRWLNNISGGNSAVPGKFDVYPDDVQHLTDFIVGGAGRSATGLYQYISNLMTGIPSPAEETPFEKGFVPSKWDSSQRYYELHDLVSQQQNEARKAVADYQKDPTTKNFNTMDKVLYNLGATQSNGKITWDNSDPIKAMRSADKQLKDLRQERMMVKDNIKLPPLMRQQQMDRIDKEMNSVMIDAGRDMSALQPKPSKGPLSGLIEKSPRR